MDALMAEIIEGHIRFHVLDPELRPTGEQKKAGDELIAVVQRYLR
jgi:DNA-binding FrmR family transcriptional regulator